MKRIIFISLAVIALLGLAIFKLFSNSKEAKKKIYIHDMEAAVLVDTDKPQMHSFESAFSYLGVFEAMHQNNVAAEGSGKLTDLLVKEGDRVVAGSRPPSRVEPLRGSVPAGTACRGRRPDS